MPPNGIRRLFKIRRVDDEWVIYKLDLCNRNYRFLTTKPTWREAYNFVLPYVKLYRKLLKGVED